MEIQVRIPAETIFHWQGIQNPSPTARPTCARTRFGKTFSGKSIVSKNEKWLVLVMDRVMYWLPIDKVEIC